MFELYCVLSDVFRYPEQFPAIAKWNTNIQYMILLMHVSVLQLIHDADDAVLP